jgi:pilus assembly protein Flp/PilA
LIGILSVSTVNGGFRMLATWIKLFKDEDGATAIEYGLIAALIAVAAVTVLGTVGTNLTATFSTVASKL